jgi:hypothetical protein
MKKANAGLMVANEVSKTKGGQEAISGTMTSVNRVQSVIGWTITALVLAGGGFLIWRFLIKPAIQKGESDAEKRASIKESELVLKEYDKLGLNVDPTKNYKGIADAIQSALSGTGEDEEAVYSQIRLISNDAEWEALKIAWAGVDGSRPVEGTFTTTSYSLTGALIGLFNESERNVVNQIFASKNMKSRI